MVRFAPSPDGDMTIRGLRVAILNYIVAKQRGDNFLVRIDDIESEKNLEGKDTEIMMILEKFAIKHDSVYHQTQHLNIYQNLALKLIREKRAFRDLENREVMVESEEVGSFTIIDSKGNPTRETEKGEQGKR